MTEQQPRSEEANRLYWNRLADEYQEVTRISTRAFHLGPLLPDAAVLGLLPADLAGKRCLEIGCGAGQNSICLARQGATCVAVDVAEEQLGHGRRLAGEAKVTVDFQRVAMEDLASTPLGRYHVVHSTFALPFATDPAAVLAAAAALLEPGGTLLLSTAHPVFAGEWLEVEDEGEGIFLGSYFAPPADVRFAELDEADVFVASRAWPLGLTIDWLHAAGLQLQRLVEPEPLPIPLMTEAEIASKVPYDSPAWRELYPQIAHVPVVAVFLATKAKDRSS